MNLVQTNFYPFYLKLAQSTKIMAYLQSIDFNP